MRRVPTLFYQVDISWRLKDQTRGAKCLAFAPAPVNLFGLRYLGILLASTS